MKEIADDKDTYQEVIWVVCKRKDGRKAMPPAFASLSWAFKGKSGKISRGVVLDQE